MHEWGESFYYILEINFSLLIWAQQVAVYQVAQEQSKPFFLWSVGSPSYSFARFLPEALNVLKHQYRISHYASFLAILPTMDDRRFISPYMKRMSKTPRTATAFRTFSASSEELSDIGLEKSSWENRIRSITVGPPSKQPFLASVDYISGSLHGCSL